MNVSLLRKVAKYILAEPKRFGGKWAVESEESPCGTRACIGGWAVALGGRISPKKLRELAYSKPHIIRSRAQKLLRLTEDQFRRLCISWPAKYGLLFNSSAEDAASRIEAFIRTKGKE